MTFLNVIGFVFNSLPRKAGIYYFNKNVIEGLLKSLFALFPFILEVLIYLQFYGFFALFFFILAVLIYLQF